MELELTGRKAGQHRLELLVGAGVPTNVMLTPNSLMSVLPTACHGTVHECPERGCYEGKQTLQIAS